jgi:four helix bundle suffix protein
VGVLWGFGEKMVILCRGFVSFVNFLKEAKEAKEVKEANEADENNKLIKENSKMKEQLIKPVGDYNKLICYQKVECIFDITYYFTEHFLQPYDRTAGQMQQAARSGKQNIAEGYTRAATSKDSAIKLIDVAKSSLIELYNDYRDYLRTRGHRQWENGSVEVQKMKELARKYNDSQFYMQLIATRPPEIIANIAICLLKQTDYLLAKLLEKISQDFLENGGFRETMTRMRIENRKK